MNDQLARQLLERIDALLGAQNADAGTTLITGTSEITGDFGGMIVVADIAFSACTPDGKYVDLSALTNAIPAGSFIPGNYKSLTPSQGEAIAINRIRR